MKVKQCCGYDPLIEYSEEELTKMYLSQGVPPKESQQRAKEAKKEIHRMNEEERLFWKTVQENETPVGDAIEQL